MIAAHRDTHFRFLRELRPGDSFEIQRRDGATVHYQVTDLRVIDSRAERIALDSAASSLELVTCFPFDAVRPGGPLRFVVTAQPAVASAQPAPAASHAAGVAGRQRNLRERAPESAVANSTKVMT